MTGQETSDCIYGAIPRFSEEKEEREEKIIGIDLHPDSFSLAVTAPDSPDSLRVLQQITQAPTAQWREYLSRLPQPSVIVCEASGNSFELMKEAEKLGFRVAILDSVDVGQIGKKLSKTDKLDAVRIAKIYRCNLALKVWLPDENTRDLREVSSLYIQITKDVSRIINRIKAFLTQHDVRLEKGKTGLAKPEVREYILKKHNWSPSDLFLLNEYYSELDHSQQTKQNLYKFILEKVHASRPMRELMKLCGIRVKSAFHLAAAIGDIKRFENPKKLVAYLGVAPCIHQSGEREYSTGMQRDGRRIARSLLVECAKSILRSKNTSARHLREWGIRLKMRWGENVAAGGLARKLAVAIGYAMNGFLPEIAENETAIKKKLATIYTEMKLEVIRVLGYKNRKEFIEGFTFAILAQHRNQPVYS